MTMTPALSTTARARALTSAGAVAALVALTNARASDHLDGPRTTADPQADITDVFAFTSPENQAHVVLAMTVTPFASASSTFSSRVDYLFRIRRVAAAAPLTPDPTPLDVTCEFDDGVPQKMTCAAPGGLQVAVAVGDATGGGGSQAPIRAFAGLRSDPAFFDRQGVLATLASGRPSFTGQNAFAGANVLAIVVELDTMAAFAGTGAGATLPVLAVACETVRRGR